MASTSGSQHRCVFVGNIPYDATEEQLIQICEEVGPVVSFRLVLDKDTGRPKGYGFCEYKDEETALSARRNLQGYEINGRQLRVDFAENDKGVDRNREQGRGGPGLIPGTDIQKSLPGQSFLGDAASQSIGYPMAAKAASVMSEALGGPHASTGLAQFHGLLSNQGSGNDSLTNFLAKMSSNQLNEIMQEMKALATKNRAQAQQLLQGSPELTKALFQVQIMFGSVTPQMMQMAANRKPSLVQDNKHDLKPLNPTYHGQSFLQKAAIEPFVRASEAQGKFVLPSSSLASMHVPLHAYPPPFAPNHIIAQGAIPGIAGVAMQPNVKTALLPASRSFSAQTQPYILHNSRPAGTIISSLSPQIASLNHPMVSSAMEMFSREKRPFVFSSDSASAPRINADASSLGLAKQIEAASKVMGASSHLSKRPRLEEGGVAHSSIRGESFIPGSQAARVGVLRDSQKQMPQISQEEESVLLQQLMSLTPEQLRSLPSEQQQQVLEIQRALRSKLLA